MTKVNDFYDALRAKLVSAPVFPNKFELPDPYSPELNPTLLLKDGWGVAIGGMGVNEVRFPILNMDRNITIILTRENYGTTQDTGIRVTAEKALLTDQQTLIRTVMASDISKGLVEEIRFAGDGGIDNIYIEGLSFLMIASSFSLTNFDQVDC